jgi:serine/threonine protein kinase
VKASERWTEIDELLDAALDLPESERATWLESVCRGKDSLRDEVERLIDLATHDDDALRTGGFWRGWSGVVSEARGRLRNDTEVLKPGGTVGPYVIRELLGQGGTGEVYRARLPHLGHDVALKALSTASQKDASHIRRFQLEAKLLRTLDHPNVAKVYDFFLLSGRPYLVLELVEGQTLAKRLLEGPMPLVEALGTALQIARALEEAHSKGVIHRDLKPGNVKLLHENDVKLLDFGLAKLMESEPDRATTSAASEPLTEAGWIVGTLQYMAPEQLDDSRVDGRTDVFAFGAVLFEMLTGVRAFAGPNPARVIAAILEREPDWSHLPKEAPSELRRLLRRCLRKDPDWRMHSIADVRIELNECLEAVGADDV